MMPHDTEIKSPKLPDHIKLFRLAASVPGPDDGTSLMRGLGPLTAMAREDRRLEVVLPPQSMDGWDLSWSWLAGCDALFLQRPWTPKEAQAMVMAKMMGLPVWVDWDDDLLCVPSYNPKAKMLTPERVGPMLEKFVRLADFVTVSTQEIARRRQEMRDNEDGARGAARPTPVAVIPNACMWPLAAGPRERRVMWRGGCNHDGDVLDVLPVLAEEAYRPQNALWKWTFVGDIPWQVEGAMPKDKMEYDPGADPFLYMRILQECRPFVHIVPLVNNAFNRARSNLAWLEATAAGALVIAPDWEEWQRPGVLHYTDLESFRSALRGVMDTFSMGQAKPAPHGGSSRPEHHLVELSRTFIREHLMLSKVNELRWEIINRMVHHQGTKNTK